MQLGGTMSYQRKRRLPSALAVDVAPLGHVAEDALRPDRPRVGCPQGPGADLATNRKTMTRTTSTSYSAT